MTYTAIMRVAGDNRVAMYQPYGTLAEAEAHIAAHIADYPDAFVVQSPQGDPADWVVDPVAKTAAYVAPPVPVPLSVSRRQAKRALLAAGLLSSVEAAVAGASAEVQIDWADALEFRRDSPTIAALAAGLGLTGAQIDDLFRTAATIQ